MCGFSKVSKIKFVSHKPSLGSCDMFHKKNLGPIGLVVLTFIGYKQTDRQAYIDIYNDLQSSSAYIQYYLILPFTPHFCFNNIS